VCNGGASWTCTATDLISVEVCETIAECLVAICEPSSGQCVTQSGNAGALCGSGTKGACDDGVCAPLPFVPPAGAEWTNAQSPPVVNVPEGCGVSGMPCVAAGISAPWLRDGGQTLCYDDDSEIPCPGTAGAAECATTPYCGQDAQYGADATDPGWSSSRFLESVSFGADVVVDLFIGAQWELTAASQLQMPWVAAEQRCTALNTEEYGGRSDWRLPSPHEAFSLFNFSVFGSGGASDFPGLPGDYIWTNGAVSSDAAGAYYVGMAVPYVSSTELMPSVQATFTARCLAVAEVPVARSRFYVSTQVPGEAVVFDAHTALTWTQTHLPDATGWSQGLAACEALDFGGSADWRAPSAVELFSIVDYSRSPAIDPVTFPNTSDSFFWTSTTAPSDVTRAFTIRFFDGELALYSAQKAVDTQLMRCVR
jgi:hypothetical protein